jgi:hypothetical protein
MCPCSKDTLNTFLKNISDSPGHGMFGGFDTPEIKKAHTDKAIGLTGDSTLRTKVLDALCGVPWPREYSFRFLKNKLSDEWAGRLGRVSVE